MNDDYRSRLILYVLKATLFVRLLSDEANAETNLASSPKPFGPVPTKQQLAWHELEFYGFVHFTVNTFTDKEWGYGDEPESVFNPTDFNAHQIVQVAKDAGMKGLILTCKHHDGFCLWPSAYTDHSVRRSPWKEGKGDVVREMSDACRELGMKFGLYLSPWDRNRKDYGSEEYITYYRNQLRELLTNYGKLFVVWFDGANGGDGFYGGTRERRTIDNRTYYGWPTTWQIVRELQPDAAIFSDAGPDFRWIGNEQGIAGDPCWATFNSKDYFPGGPIPGLESGSHPGTHWLPAECDVSIRPGWFYHQSEDAQVKTPDELLNIYYASVGRGCGLNLNLPPDRRGQIHANDIDSLKKFRRILDATFQNNLAATAKVSASNTRGNAVLYSAANAVDGKRESYWSTDDITHIAELVLTFPKPTSFNVVQLREFLALGQRVEVFALDAWKDGAWHEFYKGRGIGNQRLIRTRDTTATKIRLRIVRAPVCPAISELGVYLEPAS